ncbi:hypothetical protein [Aliikangiella coralliicola]|uniref:PilZ domain-containing protein n=1 Tax=Aliikangiella coralliicola TaxID=2592383 RepID=A0A545UBZ7_9GAMM|nr:hypothetical protein [Aliikangiella coralliicola]TQV86977.1 hypothetical protein FLL46_14300 [Aliikangiella coralliicola]
MKQGSSGLTLREYQVYHKPAIELTPRKVTQWVKNLPIANLGDSSKSIYRLLIDANQSLIDPDKRLSILNSIEPAAHELTIALEKQFLNSRIALSEKQKKIAALVQAIQTELSIGYHSVIESIISSEVKWTNKKILVSAIALAIKYHGLVILRCYQLYASVPSRIWRELYCLYQIAKQFEVENNEISVDHTKERFSAHNYFSRILLLSAANPYQLRQREIQMLWDILPELSSHITLMSHAYNKQHYIISLNSASPPIHKSLYQKDNDKNLKLTIFPAVEHLKQMLSSIKRSDQNSVRKTMLLRHLIQTWSHGTHRSFARTSCTESLDISIGLGATHYLLMQTPGEQGEDVSGSSDTLEAMEGSLKNATLLDVAKRRNEILKQDYDYLSSSGPPSDDVWAKLYRPDQVAKQKVDELEAKNRSRDSIVRDSYKLQQVSLLNMSPGGYCIQITSEKLPKHAQTGEILGFLEKDVQEREHWSIGVVRWVRRQAKGSIVQMGVQLLAPGALPINVQLRNSKSETNEYQRALILPALTGTGQPATLITNPLSFTTNSKVRILDHGQEYDARLSKEVASSSSFRQFQFEKLGGDKNSDSPEKPPQDPSYDAQDLDGVWDLI